MRPEEIRYRRPGTEAPDDLELFPAEQPDAPSASSSDWVAAGWTSAVRAEGSVHAIARSDPRPAFDTSRAPTRAADAGPPLFAASASARTRRPLVAVLLMALLAGATATGAYLYQRGVDPGAAEALAPAKQLQTTASPGSDIISPPIVPEPPARERAEAPVSGGLSNPTREPGPVAVRGGAAPSPADAGMRHPADSPVPILTASERRAPAGEPGGDVRASRAAPTVGDRTGELPASPAAPVVSDVTGEWTLSTFVESGGPQAFEGVHLNYEIRLQQYGRLITGGGFKIADQGTPLPGPQRTPVTIRGTIERDRLRLTFTELGTAERRSGTFVLFAQDDDVLRGRFSIDPARATGTAEAHRQ